MKQRLGFLNVNAEQGFTFAELIVTVAILGIIASIAMPKFTELTFETKIRKSETDIINVQKAFLTHFFESSFSGFPEFPPSPPDSLMTLEWSVQPSLYDGTSPSQLFSNGRIPFNPDGDPYVYYQLPPDSARKLSPGFKLRDPEYKIEKVFRL